MELHRLWQVPRFQLSRFLDLAAQMHEANYIPTFSNVQTFETQFKSSGYCLEPEFVVVSSDLIAHRQSYKIGYIK